MIIYIYLIKMVEQLPEMWNWLYICIANKIRNTRKKQAFILCFSRHFYDRDHWMHFTDANKFFFKFSHSLAESEIFF